MGSFRWWNMRNGYKYLPLVKWRTWRSAHTQMKPILKTEGTLFMWNELCMPWVSYHLNACLSICQWGLWVCGAFIWELNSSCEIAATEGQSHKTDVSAKSQQVWTNTREETDKGDAIAWNVFKYLAKAMLEYTCESTGAGVQAVLRVVGCGVNFSLEDICFFCPLTNPPRHHQEGHHSTSTFIFCLLPTEIQTHVVNVSIRNNKNGNKNKNVQDNEVSN